jgi:hypothetical protein
MGKVLGWLFAVVLFPLWMTFTWIIMGAAIFVGASFAYTTGIDRTVITMAHAAWPAINLERETWR